MSASNHNDLLIELETRERCGRLHVELTTELDEWMRKTFRRDGNRLDQRIQRMRYIVLFQTDLVDQIFQNPNGLTFLEVIAALGENHTERTELVTRGLKEFLMRVSAEECRKGQSVRSHIQVTWLLTIHKYVDYLDDSVFSSHVINTLAAMLNLSAQCLRLSITRGDLESNDYLALSRCYKATLHTISSLAFRGGSVCHLFNDCLDQLTRSCACFIEDNLCMRLKAQEHLVFQACITLASLAAMAENPAIVEPAMSYFRWVRILRYDTDELLGHSITNLSNRVMHNQSDTRPAEALFAYLSLCSFTASSHVRFIGAIAVTLVLDFLGNFNDRFPNYSEVESAQNDFSSLFDQLLSNTPAAQTYTKQALESRLMNEASMLGCHVDRIRSRREWSCGSQSFLAEAVLRLIGDTSPEVQRIGRMAIERIPYQILQQAVWRPSLHRCFSDESKTLVTSMLILSRRGDICLPVDILVDFVFPLSCTASM